MPKLFRPKLNQATAKAAKSPVGESTVRSRSPPTIQNVSDNAEPSVVHESTDTAKPTATEISSPKPAQKPVKTFHTQSPSAVDIDQTGSSKPSRKPTPQPQEPHSVDTVELFKRKKSKTTGYKHTADTAPPLPDQPLDRSSVSLSALLNWVPANKPPPSFRQDRSDAIADSPTDKFQKKEPPANIKTESSRGAPPTLDSTVPLDLLAPQLRLDADGNIVLDESSLLVSLPETSREDATVRHVSEETGLLNVTYDSFRPPPRRRGKRWPAHETVRFYRALSTFGRDFYLMAEMFPNRSRSELKCKFRSESRSNPYLINQALRNRRTYDVSSLLPLSDEEMEEKPIAKRKVKQETEDESEDGTGGKKKKRAIPRRRKNRMDLANAPTDNRNQSTALPYNPDNVLETIDAVLAQAILCSPVPNERDLSSTSRSPSVHQTDSADPPMEQLQLFRSSPDIRAGSSSLEQMISRAKHVVQQTSPLDDEPISPSAGRSRNSTELAIASAGSSPPSADQSNLILLDSIRGNHPKIDLLMTGRKLLGE